MSSPAAKVGDRVQFINFAGPPPPNGRTMTGQVVMLQAVVLLDREFYQAGKLPAVSVSLNALTVLSSSDSGASR